MSSDPSYWLERSYHNLIEIRFGFKFKFISTRPHIHAGSGCSITSFTTHNYKRPFAAVGHSICMICWTFVWSVGLLAYWIGKKQGIIFPNAIICLYRPCVEQERNGVRIHISRYTAGLFETRKTLLMASRIFMKMSSGWTVIWEYLNILVLILSESS